MPPSIGHLKPRSEFDDPGPRRSVYFEPERLAVPTEEVLAVALLARSGRAVRHVGNYEDYLWATAKPPCVVGDAAHEEERLLDEALPAGLRIRG